MLKKNPGERIKEHYYIEGYVVRWRRMGIDDEGKVNLFFTVVDEDGDIIVSFSVPREETKRREDVVYAAKRALGLFPDEDAPAISLTRAETPRLPDE